MWWRRSWWRHQMETFSSLQALCAGNSPFPGEFPTQRPVTRSFDVFFDLRLNKRLSKQSWGWWFEMQSGSSWCHCNVVSTLWQLRDVEDVTWWHHAGSHYLSQCLPSSILLYGITRPQWVNDTISTVCLKFTRWLSSEKHEKLHVSIITHGCSMKWCIYTKDVGQYHCWWSIFFSMAGLLGMILTLTEPIYVFDKVSDSFFSLKVMYAPFHLVVLH